MESTTHLNFNKDSEYWIAAYTRPKSEKKAARELSNMGISVYLPTQIQVHNWSDRKKKIEAVIIPMVLFAYVSDENIDKIRKNHLIIRLLTYPGERNVAHIPLEQIEKLKFILGQSDIPAEYDPNVFRVKDRVRVVRGKLMGLCGEVQSCSESHYKLVIQIDLLGGAKLKIPKNDIEIIKNQ